MSNNHFAGSVSIANWKMIYLHKDHGWVGGWVETKKKRTEPKDEAMLRGATDSQTYFCSQLLLSLSISERLVKLWDWAEMGKRSNTTNQC